MLARGGDLVSPSTQTGKHFEASALIGEVVATLGYFPAIMPLVVSERNYDLLTHHRSGVLKDARKSFPSGRKGQQFAAAKLKRYGRKNPQTIQEVRAEGVAQEDKPEDRGADALETLEFGRIVQTAKPMAIGYGGGKIDSASRALLTYLQPRGVLLSFEKGRGYVDRENKDLGRVGDRTEIYTLRRRRVARPLLGYYKRWDVSVPKALVKYEADLEKVLTEAGRAALSERIVVADTRRRTYDKAYRQFLVGSPGAYAKARAAAKAAAAEVGRDKIQ